MKRTTVALTLSTLLAASSVLLLRDDRVSCAPAAAVEAKKEPHVLRTSGTATVRIKPDAARVFFAVQTSAATIKETRTDNNARVRKIMAALTALKIPDLKSKTSDVHVDIIYGRQDLNQLPPILGYRITNSFTVLVQDEDPAKLGALASQVLDGALENGANSVQQIAFLSKEGLSQARRKALQLAVEDALANAKALGAGAKKENLETVTIDGQPTYRDPYSGRHAMMQSMNVAIPAGGGQEASMVIGDLEVTCNVNVSCTF